MKIVSVVDFSITSESILKVTKTFAKKMDAEVFLIHAEPVRAVSEEEGEYDLKPEAIRLKKDALALEKAGVNVTPVFLQGPVCESILAEALRREADLIIAGAHGHGGAHCKVPIGSISECILLKSRIPVLVVP